jgi:hypothetical protein
MRSADVRFVKVVCSHPRKPNARTHEFPEKIRLTWSSLEWNIDTTGLPIVIGKFCKDLEIDLVNGSDFKWTCRWKCPRCSFDLPLREEKLERLIECLDRIEQETTGHRRAVQLDISRAPLLLRCMSQVSPQRRQAS